MRYSFLLVPFLFLLLLLACQSNDSNRKSDEILSEEEFVHVLKDMYLVEGVYHQRGVDPYHKDSIRILYNEVLTKYDLSLEKYQKSYHFYHQDPVKMITLYEQIMEDLSIQDAQIKSKKSVQKKEE